MLLDLQVQQVLKVTKVLRVQSDHRVTQVPKELKEVLVQQVVRHQVLKEHKELQVLKVLLKVLDHKALRVPQALKEAKEHKVLQVLQVHHRI